MTLLVTGATGFVGSHFVREAVRRGVSVRAVVRRLPAALPDGVDCALVPDLSDHAALRFAMQGCTGVVHLAARVHVMRETEPDPLASFRAVNVEGARAVLAAASAAGVRRVMVLSSIKAVGEGKATPYLESDAAAPVDPYGISKLEAEELVLAPDDTGVEGVVLRTPLVYGPGVRGNFLRLLSLARLARWLPLPLGGIDNRRSLVYVLNLVDALMHLSHARDVAHQRFNVSDGEDLSTSELIRRIGDAGGWRVRLAPCPTRILRVAASRVGRAPETDRLLSSLTLDTALLRATGWRPPYTVHEGLASTVQWYLARAAAHA